MLHGPKPTQKRAAQLRAQMTLPEILLWRELRNRPSGLKFRRQHPAGPYILDFFCASSRLAIEVDGLSHDFNDRPDYDARRDLWLAGNGVKVLRIPATDVLRDVDAVVRHIVASARSGQLPLRHRSAMPPPLAGED